MRNMKIGHRLILGFSVIAVIAVIIGIMGLQSMRDMKNADTRLYERNMTGIVKSYDMMQNLTTQRANLRDIIISVLPSNNLTVEQTVSTLRQSEQSLKVMMDDFASWAQLAASVENFKKFRELYDGTFTQGKEQLISNAGYDRLDNMVVTLQSMTSTYTNMSNYLQACVEANKEGAAEAMDENNSIFLFAYWLQLILLVCAVVFSGIIAVVITKTVAVPIRTLKSVLDDIGATGNLDVSPETIEGLRKESLMKDEMGLMVGSFGAMMERIVESAHSLADVAGGDLTIEVKPISTSDTMGNAVKQVVDNLNSMFAEMSNVAQQVTVGSKQVSDGSQALAQGTTEQAASVEQLSSSISEVADKTRENSQKASSASHLATTIKTNAEKGSHQMEQMMQATKEINDASQNISKVIKVIDDIAFQTNILALNAAVEAARAGQHGKGFAVVAEEVRNLAAKSAEAAKSTGALIVNSIEKAELGAKIASETSGSLTEIVEGINESAIIVEDIATSSEEQASAITQINRGIDQVAQVVQQNSATAEESAAASQEMSGQATILSDLLTQFKFKNAGGSRFGGSNQTRPQQLSLPQKSTISTSNDKY